MARGDVIKRLIQDMCKELAHAEFIHEVGVAWLGGKLGANFISGRLPFRVWPGNHGTVLITIPDSTNTTTHGDYGTQAITFDTPYPATTVPSGATSGSNIVTVASTAGLFPGQRVRFIQAGGGHLTETQKLTAVDHPNKLITFSGGSLANTYANGDAVQVIPDIKPGSGDIGWDATYANVTNLGFDLTLARRVSLTNSEGGLYTQHFNTGDTFHDHPIVFPVPYQATPVFIPQTDDPAFPVSFYGLTATGATIRVTHINTSASGTVGYSPTGITATDNSAPGSTGGPSDNESDLTTVNTDSTGAASTVNHQHSIPSGTDAGGGTTGAGGVNHAHGVGDHSHGLKHHTHGTPAHDHDLTEPVVGGNTGHNHLFAGDSTAVGAASDHTITWIAFGTRTSGVVTKEASYLAISA